MTTIQPTSNQATIRPKISVVVAVYKVEQYIERCCRTLFGQTLDNIEYVFVNDCTPDRSIDVMRQVLAEFPNRRNQVHVINHKHNQGVAATRQHGIEAATGEYIIHCDPDDWVELNMYETLYAAAKSNGVQMATCDFKFMYTNGRTRQKSERPEQMNGLGVMEGICGIRRKILWGVLWNKLIAAECYVQGCHFVSSVNVYEDELFLFQLLPHIDRVVHIDRVLYYHQRHNESILSKASQDKERSAHNTQILCDWVQRNIVASDNPAVSRCGKSYIIKHLFCPAFTLGVYSSQQWRVHFGQYRSYISCYKAQLPPPIIAV